MRSWKAKVRQAAVARLPIGTPTIGDSVQVIIAHYYDKARPDIDNCIKPILDALNGVIYDDDKQITDLTVRQRNINGLFRVRGMSLILAHAFANGEEFIHIKIDAPPDPTELSL